MKNILSILLLAMMACCWSCSGGGEDVPTPTPTPTPKPEEKPKIELTTAAPVAPQEGGSATVTFTSTEAWTIDVTEGRAVSWCSVTPTSGSKGTNTLTVKTTANDTYDERNAKVTIKAGATTQSFVVTQKQKDAIIVAKNEYTIEAAGGSLDFEVNTNVDFKVETSVDWIKQNTKSRGLEAKPLSFKIAENTADEAREGLITITSGDLKQEIKVLQKAKTTFSVSETEFKFYASGGEFELNVTSDGEYTIEFWESWLKEKSCETISSITKKHTFSVAPNTNYYTNEGHIYLTNTKTNENVVVKVIVAEKFVEAQNEYNLSAISTSLEFELLVEDDYKVEIFEDWIVQRKIDNETGKKLVFDVEKNRGEVRSGKVMFTTEGNSQYVIIKQQSGISNNEGSIDNMPEYEW